MVENAYKILVIEDYGENLKLFSEILKRNGYETLKAKNVIEGIKLARSEKPHLILMDIEMPLLNGLEIFKIIKSEPSIKDVPIIALASHITRGTKKRFLELGFADCISKPFGLHEFIRIVDKHSMEFKHNK